MSEYNITIIGDSVSKGLYLKDNQIMRIVPSAVDIVNESLGLSIQNKSSFGQTLKRVYERGIVDEYLKTISSLHSNVVVIALGGNDADYHWNEVQGNPLLNHRPKTDLAEFRILMNEIIRKLQARGVKVVLSSLFPIDSKRYFENVLSQKYDKDKILKFLNNDILNISRHQEMFNIECLKAAFKNGCAFLDLRTHFLNKENLLDYMCEDGIHPNQKGQEFMSEIIINKICAQQKRGFLIPNLEREFISGVQR